MSPAGYDNWRDCEALLKDMPHDLVVISPALRSTMVAKLNASIEPLFRKYVYLPMIL
jgi:hypothetical protein